MHNTLLALLGAALIPMLVGLVWYSKILFGPSWMRANRFLPEDMKKANMALIIGLTLLFSFMLSTALRAVVVHQAAIGSIIAGRYKTPEAQTWADDAMRRFGDNYRTFKHGAFHGVISAVFLALPVFGIVALFERRSWKYVLIHLGYWVVTLALMGGIICQFS